MRSMRDKFEATTDFLAQGTWFPVPGQRPKSRLMLPRQRTCEARTMDCAPKGGATILPLCCAKDGE